MEHTPAWVANSFVYLNAAHRRADQPSAVLLGSIIGDLAAGIAIGPWGLELVTHVGNILHFAEFGVVLMLAGLGLGVNWRTALVAGLGWHCRARRSHYR